jgi:structural maintenance of chromosome 4
MMTHIELENFLAFPGVQKIGPFHKKFSIRELNDGGRNSLVDALLFVFGKRSRQPENNKTAELIHRSPRYPNMEYCRVSVQFQLIIDDESSEEVYEVLTDSSFVITRVAYKDNGAEYMLDNRSSRLNNLAPVFVQYGTDLDSNRYLFLHGDLTKIPDLRPKATSPQELALLDYADEIFGPDVVTQEYAVAQGRISTPYNNASLSTNDGTVRDLLVVVGTHHGCRFGIHR